MSQDNVERIRAMFEGFNRDGFEAALPYIAPDAVWYPFPEWPGPAEYHGLDGARQLASEWTENFDDYRWVLDELIDKGDAVVVLAHHTGRIKGAGTPVEHRVAGVLTDFDDEGRTAKAWYFLSWEEALEAADSTE